jgi:hypothetical protein
MIPGNFDWFLHSMLFYHTKHVLKRQGGGDSTGEDSSDEDSSGGDSSGEDNSSEDMETNEDD